MTSSASAPRASSDRIPKIHEPVWAVTGTLGDSQCYLGVTAEGRGDPGGARRRASARDDLPVRLIPPALTHRRVRRAAERHRPHALLADRPRARERLRSTRTSTRNDVTGLIAVRRVRQAAGRHARRGARAQRPAVFLSDGSIQPGTDPGDRRAHRPRHRVPDRRRPRSGPAHAHGAARLSRARAAAAACSRTTRCSRSSRVLGMEPLHMVAPPSDDARRLEEFPDAARRLPRHDDAEGIRPATS